MKPIRVVHYNHTDIVAGAERVLLNLLPRLPGHGFESILLSPVGHLHEEAQKLGIQTVPCHSLHARFTSNPWKLARYLWSFAVSIRSIRRQLHDLHPDLVHANSIRAGLVVTTATIGLNTRSSGMCMMHSRATRSLPPSASSLPFLGVPVPLLSRTPLAASLPEDHPVASFPRRWKYCTTP